MHCSLSYEIFFIVSECVNHLEIAVLNALYWVLYSKVHNTAEKQKIVLVLWIWDADSKSGIGYTFSCTLIK